MPEDGNDTNKSKKEEAEFMHLEEYLDTYWEDYEEEEAEKIKDMVGAVWGNQEKSQTTGRLPTLLPVTQYAPLHHPKERHDWHAQCSPDFASNSCPLDYLQLFSIMTFLTCWYKIQTCILLVKMPGPMRLGPGSQPQFQK